MQPRSSSQQIDGQNTHMNQSPMATQGSYNVYCVVFENKKKGIVKDCTIKMFIKQLEILGVLNKC